MPVVVFWIIHIIEPLLQLAILAYMHRRQLAAHLFDGIGKSRISTQYGGGPYYSAKGIKHNLVGHGYTCIQRGTLVRRGAIFGRLVGVYYQPAIFWMFYKIVSIKSGGTF